MKVRTMREGLRTWKQKLDKTTTRKLLKGLSPESELVDCLKIGFISASVEVVVALLPNSSGFRHSTLELRVKGVRAGHDELHL